MVMFFFVKSVNMYVLNQSRVGKKYVTQKKEIGVFKGKPRILERLPW